MPPLQDSPPTAVLDTHVVLDWLVFGDTRVQPLVRAITAGQLRWLNSARMRAELSHVLGRPALHPWSPDVPKVLAVVDQLAEACADPPPSHLNCSDPDDQVFIDLALAQRAPWLLTRDKALLRLARRAQARGTRVCSPEAWAALNT